MHCRKEAIEKFDKHGYGSILKLAQIPLLKGINDDSAVLHELFMDLYAGCKVKPYYLLHSMPWSPGAAQYRTSIRKGISLMNNLKRRIANPAMPEYIIVHDTGKLTVPPEIEGTPGFQYITTDEGLPAIRFKNWKGNTEIYLDGRD